jgi:hypothetical protein
MVRTLLLSFGERTATYISFDQPLVTCRMVVLSRTRRTQLGDGTCCTLVDVRATYCNQNWKHNEQQLNVSIR